MNKERRDLLERLRKAADAAVVRQIRKPRRSIDPKAGTSVETGRKAAVASLFQDK